MGVRAKLVALVVLVTVPLLALEGVNIYQRFQQHETQELQANLELSGAIAAAFDHYLESLWSTEFAIGNAVTDAPPSFVPTQAEVLMREQLPDHPAVVRFIWLSPRGEVLAATDPGVEGLNLGSQEHIARIMAGEERTVSDLMSVPDHDHPIVGVARGVRHNGKLDGIVVATLDAHKLDLILPVERHGDRIIGLVDRQGLIVYRSTPTQPPMDRRRITGDGPAARLFRGEVGVVRRFTSTADQLDRMGAAVPIESFGWVAFATSPVHEVLAVAWAATRRDLAVTLLALLVSAAAVALIGRWLVRPILTLQRAAEAIAVGDLSARVELHGPDEVSRAARTFNEMAARIQQTEAELSTRARQQAAVAELSQAALAGGDTMSVVNRAVALVSEILGAQHCALFQLPGGRSLLLRAAAGWPAEMVGRYREAADRSTQGGYTLSAAGPVVVPDLRREDRFTPPPHLLEWGAASSIGVVIRGRERPEGVLVAHTARLRSFSPDDVHFLQAVSNLLATAMERSSAEARLAVQYTVTRTLAESASVEEAAPGVMQAVCTIMGWDIGVLWLSDPEARGFRAAGIWSSPDLAASELVSVTRNRSLPTDRGLAAEVCRRGEPMALADVAAHPNFLRGLEARRAGLHGAAIIPIFLGQEVHGFLGVMSREPGEPTGEHISTLSTIASQVAQFIERQRAREALKALNADLEQQVTHRTAELAAANEELEAFAYSVSHDLRAPLRSIDGFSHALEEDCAGALDPDGQEYLHRIRGAARRMDGLIDDLLRLSRVMRSELRREWVDLTAMARAVAAELAQSDPDRTGVHFQIPEGMAAHGDERLLQVALENLLSNAWKFTARQAEARIEFGVTSVDGEQVFYVRDNGAGFDMAYAAQLFRPFHRLHSPAEFAGSGIGLATVQRVIHRHGGRIWAEGESGRGAVFYFTL